MGWVWITLALAAAGGIVAGVRYWWRSRNGWTLSLLAAVASAGLCLVHLEGHRWIWAAVFGAMAFGYAVVGVRLAYLPPSERRLVLQASRGN